MLYTLAAPIDVMTIMPPGCVVFRTEREALAALDIVIRALPACSDWRVYAVDAEWSETVPADDDSVGNSRRLAKPAPAIISFTDDKPYRLTLSFTHEDQRDAFHASLQRMSVAFLDGTVTVERHTA